MRKLIFFFIVMVTIVTISIMNTSNTNTKKLSQADIDNFRNSLIKKNPSLSNDDLEEEINIYVQSTTNAKKVNKKTFAEAFPEALKITAIVCGCVAIIFLIKGSYYNELLTSGLWVQGRKNTIDGRIEINNTKAKRNFWGRWFK